MFLAWCGQHDLVEVRCRRRETVHLRSIDKLTSDSADFEQLEQLFEPVLHNILLIWRYSKFYTTPTRLAVLIREICCLVEG